MFDFNKAPICCRFPETHPGDKDCLRLIKRGKEPLPLCKELVIEKGKEESSEPLPDWLLELLIKLREAENPTTNEYRIFADGLQNQGMSGRAKALTEFMLRESLGQAAPTSDADFVALGQVAVCHAQACRALGDKHKEQISRSLAAKYLAASEMKASGGSSAEIESLIHSAQGLIDSLSN